MSIVTSSLIAITSASGSWLLSTEQSSWQKALQNNIETNILEDNNNTVDQDIFAGKIFRL